MIRFLLAVTVLAGVCIYVIKNHTDTKPLIKVENMINESLDVQAEDTPNRPWWARKKKSSEESVHEFKDMGQALDWINDVCKADVKEYRFFADGSYSAVCNK